MQFRQVLKMSGNIDAEHLQAEMPPGPDVCVPTEMLPSDIQTGPAGSHLSRPRNPPDRLAFGHVAILSWRHVRFVR
jgi:hypothetical protein